MRPRVCGAILKNNSILMVQHRDSERVYWTLPGGGIEQGETPAEAVVREVREETGLEAKVSRLLFEETYLGGTSPSWCFLLDIAEHQSALLGHDPEEAHLEPVARLLQGVAWFGLESVSSDFQVAKVLEALSML